jgi:D-xylose 1-dehydrogenase (NADP+, D-xylono-1,5-lactone-forming)
MTQLSFGVLGTARIAEAFMYAASISSRARVTAVGTRDPDRGRVFAERHGVARVCSYDDVLADPAIDAVYIPLPNSMHGPWAIAAARAGKHVLCEKPLAIDETEAIAMFAAAEASGVVLLEAFPYHFQPQTLDVVRRVTAGEIGELRLIQASFGFTIANQSDIRFDPALAGGALMDAGCYPVSLIRLLVGRRPARVTAVAQRAPSGVDVSLVANLEYDHCLAQISCSMGTAVHRRAVIAGTAGVIETDYQNSTSRFASPVNRIKRGTDWSVDFETVPVPREDGFRLELEAFIDLIADRSGLAAYRAASLDNAWTLDAIRRAASAS